jgi:hypothetical protein
VVATIITAQPSHRDESRSCSSSVSPFESRN